MAGFDSADPRPEWTPVLPEPTPVSEGGPVPMFYGAAGPNPDDGTILVGEAGGFHVSVGQAKALPPYGPWGAWVGPERIGSVAGYATSVEARGAVETELGLPVGSIGWTVKSEGETAADRAEVGAAATEAAPEK